MTVAAQPETWDDALPIYSAYLRAGGASPGTIKIRRRYVTGLARQFPELSPWALTIDHLTLFLGDPARELWKPETRHSARTSLRSFYGWAVKTGRIPSSPGEALPKVTVPPADPRPAPDYVFERAWAEADPRARLMLALAAFDGLRRSEIACLHTDHLVDDDMLRVPGKGGKWRTIPLHPVVAEVLRARPSGFVFPGMDHGHLSPDAVGRIMSRALGRGWTAHTLRHRFGTLAREATDVLVAQKLLGHAHLNTTRIYTAVRGAELRAAVLATGPAA